ncbi:BA75_00317T0 [Komagataella pastoris]|uniref:BA75_00317T0 n=1 Tax=Komagataella pastoris TaxID=4922 RepID=A0A1B2J9S9_PICPA|nr:BA75_00317T0 [Komagataella pastoris]
MKPSNLILLLVLSIGHSIAGSNLPSKANKLPFKKLRASSPHKRFLKRDGPYHPLEADAFLYYTTTILVGSEEEEVRVTIDLETSDLWVVDYNTGLCDRYFDSTYLKRSLDTSQEGCTSGAGDFAPSVGISSTRKLLRKREFNETETYEGNYADCPLSITFDPDNSSSFQSNDTTFNISYFNGFTASGFWATDTIHFGDLEVNKQFFGLANLTTSYNGVLGLGPSNLQTTNANPTGEKFIYSGVLDSMRDQGLINSASFSIYLNPEKIGFEDSYSDDEGAILFGAIDNAKIDGSLKLLPYVTSGGRSQTDANFTYVTLNNIAVTANDTSLIVETNPQLAMLNPKFMYSYFPNEVLTRLVNSIGSSLEYDSIEELYRIRTADLGDIREKVIEFQFGDDVVIHSPVSDYLYNVWLSGKNYTYLEIQDSKEDFFILGNAFFKSAYLFLDNDNSEVGIGQLKITVEEDIVPVGDFSLDRDSGYSSTWSTFTYETGSAPLGTLTLASTSEVASETGTETSSDGAAPSVSYVSTSSYLFLFVLLFL